MDYGKATTLRDLREAQKTCVPAPFTGFQDVTQFEISEFVSSFLVFACRQIMNNEIQMFENIIYDRRCAGNVTDAKSLRPKTGSSPLGAG